MPPELKVDDVGRYAQEKARHGGGCPRVEDVVLVSTVVPCEIHDRTPNPVTPQEISQGNKVRLDASVWWRIRAQLQYVHAQECGSLPYESESIALSRLAPGLGLSTIHRWSHEYA